MKIVGIFNDKFFRQKPTTIPHKLWEVICSRANPRTFEYMQQLFKSKYPEGMIVNIDANSESYDTLVLLHPDAIGLGQTFTEIRLKNKAKKTYILNGRQRSFELTKSMHLKLVIRRILEVSFLFEVIIAPFLLVYGFCMIVKDQLSDRQ